MKRRHPISPVRSLTVITRSLLRLSCGIRSIVGFSHQSISPCASAADAAAETALAGVAESLLADYPENATGLGLDTHEGIELTPVRVVETPEVTHIRYAVGDRAKLELDDRGSGGA